MGVQNGNTAINHMRPDATPNLTRNHENWYITLREQIHAHNERRNAPLLRLCAPMSLEARLNMNIPATAVVRAHMELAAAEVGLTLEGFEAMTIAQHHERQEEF
jgi:hypothetical protein